ncbi:MAG: hypothetical protein LLG42_15075 [Chloroflexi bacterium]|nr:hypothetical protein [Chloroflexota bacterium]
MSVMNLTYPENISTTSIFFNNPQTQIGGSLHNLWKFRKKVISDCETQNFTSSSQVDSFVINHYNLDTQIELINEAVTDYEEIFDALIKLQPLSTRTIQVVVKNIGEGKIKYFIPEEE